MIEVERIRWQVRGPACRVMAAAVAAASLMVCISPGLGADAATGPAPASDEADDIARLDRAVEELREAYERNPSNSNHRKLGEAESRAADAHIALAERYVRQGRLHEARRELATALSQVPAHPRGVPLARQVGRDLERKEELLRGIQTALDLRDDATALERIDEALAITPGDADLARQRQEIVARLSAEVRDRYERLALAGQWELAWPAAVLGTMLQPPGDGGAVQDLKRAEEQIGERIGYRLRVVPVASPEVPAGQVLAVAAALAGELERTRPAHVDVLPFQVTADALARGRLTLADVSDPAKLKALDGGLTGKDLCLFMELSGLRPDGAGAAGRQPGTPPDQARVDLQQAREKLGRARQLALADERKRDEKAARALATDETFLPEALKGSYGPQARQAAENYEAALRRLQPVPGGPDTGDADSRARASARLRLVQASTGEVLWSEDDAAVEVPTSAAGVPFEMPAIRHLARQTFARRSLAYLDHARKYQGDEAIIHCVRFLFDCSADPGADALAEAVGVVFDDQTAGRHAEACRRLALERLRLRFAAAASQPEPLASQTAVPPAPVAGPARTAPAPGVPPLEPRYRVEPQRVFEGAVSRKDKRYPKEQLVVDGITVKVRDTDAKPLDADLEITVGQYRGRFDDLRVGTRLRVRGASGEDYRLTILGIEDRYETVRFSLERLPEQPGR